MQISENFLASTKATSGRFTLQSSMGIPTTLYNTSRHSTFANSSSSMQSTFPSSCSLLLYNIALNKLVSLAFVDAKKFSEICITLHYSLLLLAYTADSYTCRTAPQL